MGVIMLVPIVYVAAVAQTSLVDLLQVGRVAPDLLALAAILWLLATPASPWGPLAAGAVGLLEDLISPGNVGLGAAAFLLAAYVVVRVRSRLRLEELPWRVLTVWLAVTLIEVLLAAGKWLFGELAMDPGTLVVRAVGVGVYTAGVSLPAAMVLGWIGHSHKLPQS